VRINLSSIRDAEFVDKLRREAGGLEKEAVEKESHLLNHIKSIQCL